MVDVVHYVYRKFPKLRREMQMAHMKISPLDFIKKTITNAALFSVALGFFSMFMLRKLFADFGLPEFLVPVFAIIVVMPIIFFLVLSLFLAAPVSIIKKRRQEIEREVLFAGRYLLIKLDSGQPLMNALADAAKSYGVASKYFKEIVDDITLGTPIEEAIERAINLSPSPAFQKILFQINNSLMLGVDVTDSLQSVLEDITHEQITEIEEYGSKLNSVTLFYMLVAVVGPSLGLTIFVVVAGMVGFTITNALYFVMWGAIVAVQALFMNVFKAIRPDINL